MVEPIAAEYERRKAAAHTAFLRQKGRADVFAIFVGILGLMTARQLWLAIGGTLHLRSTGIALAATLMCSRCGAWWSPANASSPASRVSTQPLDRVHDVVPQTGHIGEDFVAYSIGALSTHDLALAELAELPGLHGRNVHMASPDESDPLAFDYLLKPGVNRTTNALAIVKMLGLS